MGEQSIYPSQGGSVEVRRLFGTTRLIVDWPNGRGEVELSDYERQGLIRALEADHER